jgi:GDPmannose 4,6-dehydratase
LLISEGWEVHGTSITNVEDQDSQSSKINFHSLDLTNFHETRTLLRDIEPEVIFNLAAISSVAESWENPSKTYELNSQLVSVILESLSNKSTFRNLNTVFVQASSSEIFGQSVHSPQNELTPISPINPYGASKAAAHLLTNVYREKGLKASNCILYNHESIRRPVNFVTRKITHSVAKISLGLQDKLTLGNLDIARDWGWAPDYAKAMYLVANAEKPGNFVIATGKLHTLRELLQISFTSVGIENWDNLVESSPEFIRPTETTVAVGDPRKITEELGWAPSVTFESMITDMVHFDLELLSQSQN